MQIVLMLYIGNCNPLCGEVDLDVKCTALIIESMERGRRFNEVGVRR